MIKNDYTGMSSTGRVFFFYVLAALVRVVLIIPLSLLSTRIFGLWGILPLIVAIGILHFTVIKFADDFLASKIVKNHE